ncbi:MAG: EamA family transporter [Eubacteriales bacterium]|nr:EamA family transporter [Eubacteriales bacterium]MDD3198791.1 EamA family transporter [Eubacteriales bacterium]MDD4630581.1 EamA family transporter [Eubacteriales bacterium]
MSSDNEKKRAIFYMVMCALLWSTAGIFIKLLPWNPIVIAGGRSLISAGVFFLYMRHENTPFVINRASIIGGIATSATFTVFVVANKLTTAANAIVLQYSAPIFILILSTLFYHQKFKKGDIITVGITMLGISLFFFDELSGGYLSGNILAIISGLCFASMFVITGNANVESRASGILLGHLITFTIGLPFMILSDTSITTSNIMIIIAMGIFQLGIPYILYGMAVRKCSPLTCSLISVIEPLVNPIWVLLFYGEKPGFFALIGGGIVISAVVSWTIWSSKQERKSQDNSDVT